MYSTVTDSSLSLVLFHPPSPLLMSPQVSSPLACLPNHLVMRFSASRGRNIREDIRQSWNQRQLGDDVADQILEERAQSRLRSRLEADLVVIQEALEKNKSQHWPLDAPGTDGRTDGRTHPFLEMRRR